MFLIELFQLKVQNVHQKMEKVLVLNYFDKQFSSTVLSYQELTT